jgi:hypothetical protein
LAQLSLYSSDGTLQATVSTSRARMQRLAKHWHYVLRSRRRWIKDPKLRQIIEERAIDHLKAIGIGDAQLSGLGSSGLVEVSINYSPTDQWEDRLLPWEYLLSVATRRFRNDDPFLVARSLTFATPATISSNNKGLLVRSAPGQLHDEYNFETECEVIAKHLPTGINLKVLENPTLELLRAEVAADSPEVMHITGIDNFQGMHFLDPEQNTAVSSIHDGMYLRDSHWNEQMTDARTLAEAVACAALKPGVVSFNLYNSSARIAALTAASGAGAALGFQDSVEDNLAEIFFANYYLYWSTCNKQPLLAFWRAMESLAPYRDRMQGTGIVYWSSTRLTPIAAPNFFDHIPLPLKEASKDGQKLRDWVRVDISPRSKLNYSILHNENRPLFESFAIYRLEPRLLEDLEVEVKLQIGGEEFPYRQAITLRDHVSELADQIGVGLTSRLARSLQEAVRTTLFVRVAKSDDQLYSKTDQVSLLPVNEWRDDDISRRWLPSFVLPRDPAVPQIIVAAQRYLMALEDDASAGFDGYQGIDADSDDATWRVDAQVRALWCALLHDFQLNYINPPPTFTAQSQRLRTPTTVLAGRRGTCIDLSLIIAACLEYVGINPVIFLLNGHAFPGYWSCDARRDEVLTVEPPLVETPDFPTPLPDEKEEREETESYIQIVPWVFDRSRYEEVFECVRRGDIVPLESTLLTNRGGFWEAIEEGERNLQNPEEFHSMLDIKLARDVDVTPLPLAEFEGD